MYKKSLNHLDADLSIKLFLSFSRSLESLIGGKLDTSIKETAWFYQDNLNKNKEVKETDFGSLWLIPMQ